MLNKTETKAVVLMVKTGFTFYGDNFAATFQSAKRALDALVRKGYATKTGDEFEPTEAARDFVNYGITL
jgi:hypothetical protein